MSNLPAEQNKSKKVSPDVIEKGTGRIAKKGGYYKNKGGEFEADAWRVQEQSNDFEISVEILEKTVTNEYVEVIARGHHPKGYYVDGIVHHNFQTIANKKVMEYFKKVVAGKNIAFGPEGARSKIDVFVDPKTPFVMDESMTAVPNLTGMGTAKLLDDMLQFRDIAIRDATTKAMAIVQRKLTNQDWREAEEKAAEKAEVQALNKDGEIEKSTQKEVDENNAKKAEIKRKKEEAAKKAKQEKSKDTKQEGKTDKVKTENKKTVAKPEEQINKEKEEEKKEERKKKIIKQDDGSELETPPKKTEKKRPGDGYDHPNWNELSPEEALDELIELVSESGEPVVQVNVSKRLQMLKREKVMNNKKFIGVKEAMLKYFVKIANEEDQKEEKEE